MNAHLLEPTDALQNESLIHCIYASTAVAPLAPGELNALLAKAKHNNAGLGVTGMLLYENGDFFQVLEGPEEVVHRLFEKIARDRRHSHVTKIIAERIEHRRFADWTMGYTAVTQEQLQELEGLNDFFRQGKCFSDLDEGRAKLLLQAFKEGRWRRTIR
ncbi:MAG: BLUF domain-containing protein [Burkholderiaceae bacterium]